MHRLINKCPLFNYAAALLSVSPGGEYLAIVPAEQDAVCIFPLVGDGRGEQRKPHRFSSTVLRQAGKVQVPEPERFTAVAWSGDSNKLLVAGAGGVLYLLGRYAGENWAGAGAAGAHGAQLAFTAVQTCPPSCAFPYPAAMAT